LQSSDWRSASQFRTASLASASRKPTGFGAKSAGFVLKATLNLAARVTRRPKRPIVLANIQPTQAQAADLLTIYAKVVAAWTEGQARIIAEYERTIAEMTTDSPATTGSAIDEIGAQIQRLVIMLTPDLRRWALRVEDVHRGKWVRSVLSAADVDLNTILTAGDVEDTLGASINWNVSLIRDISNELQRRISNAVFAGFQRRASAADIAKEIREATGMSRARARRVASDQNSKLGAQLNRARQLQAGLTHYKWRSSHKLHFRPAHQARDGKVFPWEGPGSIAPDDRCGVPPFCGCTAQGVLVFDDAKH
jgi:SPP1 gp7 family putative phage head morphogenesis protein